MTTTTDQRTDAALTRLYNRASETLGRRAETDGAWCPCRSCGAAQRRWEALQARMIDRGLNWMGP